MTAAGLRAFANARAHPFKEKVMVSVRGGLVLWEGVVRVPKSRRGLTLRLSGTASGRASFTGDEF